MQGCGKEHCYLGIDHPFDTASVVIQPVAFDLTATYVKGADRGPAALIEASRNLELYDIETRSQVYEEGIHTAPEIRVQNSEEMLEMTYKAVSSHMEEGKYVVTLGGEHSTSLAPIRAHSERYGPISILQLDAHTDLVSAYEGNSYSHASVMAQVKTLPEVDHVVAVGIRSMAKEEVSAMDAQKVFFAHELEGEDWMDRVIKQLSDRVYLTFDLDVFDSSLMPATGTPEPGGLFWNPALKLMKKVIQKRSLIGFDVVELCPISGLVAPDYLAAKLVYKILSYLFHN